MFGEEEILSGILSHIEGGVALTTMADLITKGGVMTGLHSIDVGIMVSPVLVEMMISAAEAADIEYKVGTEVEQKQGSTPASIRAAMSSVEEKDEPMLELEETPVEEPEEASMGMMTRRGV